MNHEPHNIALARYLRAQRRSDGRDDLEQTAREQILAALADGSTLDCGGYTLDSEDFGIFVGEREDWPATVHAFHVAKTMPLADFLVYLSKQEEGYADFHAGARADVLEQNTRDEADYCEDDR